MSGDTAAAPAAGEALRVDPASPPDPRPLEICTDMTADMFHVGHLRLLQRIRTLWPQGRTTVLVDSDEVVLALKRRAPVVTLADRLEILAACRFVDAVIPIFEPRYPPELIDRFDLLVRGDDGWPDGPAAAHPQWYAHAVARGMMRLLPRTPDVSSTLLKQRATVATAA
jgi:cytidyltransferase-like protein